MALAIGTNSGFVSAAPVADPGGTVGAIGGRANATKDTSPAGSNTVAEIGWWQDKTTNLALDYECAIYSHDAGNDRPNVILESKTGQTLTADTAAWYKYIGFSYALTASTTYWVATQCDRNAAISDAQYDYESSGGVRLAIVDAIALPDPYGIPDHLFANYMAAMYAKYVAAGGLSIPIAMHHHKMQGQ